MNQKTMIAVAILLLLLWSKRRETTETTITFEDPDTGETVEIPS